MRASIYLNFIKSIESSPGVYTEEVLVKKASAFTIINKDSSSSSSEFSANIRLNSSFSIIADEYLVCNQPYLKYITYGGNNWKVDNITYIHPRAIISIGGLYVV